MSTTTNPPIPADADEIPRDEMITELQEIALTVERPPTPNDIDEHSRFGFSTFKQKFDGLKQARAEAGCDKLGMAIVLGELDPHTVEQRVPTTPAPTTSDDDDDHDHDD